MDILEVNNLTKEYKKKTAVKNVSFSLKEGEILGFLGPNGAGKTTTIAMLSGILTPTSGTIKYFGKSLVAHREEILDQINFSTTYTNLPLNLTVKENLIFISYLYTIPNRKKRLKEIIEIFRIQDLLKLQMTALSAGQRTRINLAKALLNFPKVLLLDEPTASLDPDIALYIRDFLQKERKKFQVSILFTSHNMREVEEICDRVIFINNGEIVADDTPDGLAKTIKVAHLELLVLKNLDKAIVYLKTHNYVYAMDGKYMKADVEEHHIAQILRDFGRLKIEYGEISIDKPTLEDYFLEKSSMRKDVNEIS